MAKPIKETPILRGKDAQKFIEQHSKTKNEAVLKREAQRIMQNYNRFKVAEISDRHLTT